MALQRAARAWTLALLAALATLAPRAAHACGSSGADGVSACSLEEHEEAERLKWRVGIGGLATSTAIHFSTPAGGLHAGETRLATEASLSYAPSSRVTLEAGAGAALGGHLTLPDGTHDFSVGPTLAIGASWRVVQGRPFVILTSFLSFTASTTDTNGAGAAIGYEAFDLRLGGIVGTTLWNVVSPYALARAFGGPVYWRYEGAAVTGTDTHHYQLGAGGAVAIAHRLDLYVEGVPLGEQAVAAGLGVAF
jgi:hypothetical protein